MSTTKEYGFWVDMPAFIHISFPDEGYNQNLLYMYIRISWEGHLSKLPVFKLWIIWTNTFSGNSMLQFTSYMQCPYNACAMTNIVVCIVNSTASLPLQYSGHPWWQYDRCQLWPDCCGATCYNSGPGEASTWLAADQVFQLSTADYGEGKVCRIHHTLYL